MRLIHCGPCWPPPSLTAQAPGLRSVAARPLLNPERRISAMAWTTPKIVELPVGMEINMYACAKAK